MVANVVISALMPSCAMTKPLSNPTSAPERTPAAMPTSAESAQLDTTAPTIPPIATTEPTDKSKSPAARQKSIVQEIIPTTVTDSSSPLRFTRLKKLSTKIAQQMNIRTNTRSMPAFCQSERTMDGADSGAGGVA